MHLDSWRAAGLGALAVALCALGASPARAQTTDSGRQTGLHYYAVENLETHQVEQRGIAGSGGVAFSNLILRPQTRYRIWLLQASTLRVGRVELTTPATGVRFQIPEIRIRPASSFDFDRDGLHDQGEWVLGTDSRNPDTDGDGIQDGAEVLQGLDPLGGLPARTGVVASVDTPGTAVDVAAANDFAVVADSAAGISVFNVFNRLNPQAIARVRTLGNAGRVAISKTWVAVACGSQGLAIVDVSDPPAAHVTHQVSSLVLGGQATSVTALEDVAFVGTTTGDVVAVDLVSGGVLIRAHLAREVFDLAIERGVLYALTDQGLSASTIGASGLLSAPTSLALGQSSPRRLFVGGGIAYAVHFNGYSTIDVRGSGPSLIAQGGAGLFGWSQLVLNGSGLALAAVGPNSSRTVQQELSLYDAHDPAQPGLFQGTFPTPGTALSVSLYDGLAYVADGARGLQVVNYLSYDTQGVAPLITLTSSFPSQQIEEGKLVWIAADVSDDVQVRNVEFYVDGVKVLTDGNYPFELSFTTPPRAAGRTSFTLRARASDTGGNRTWTALRTIELLADQTPPQILTVSPPDGSVIGTRPTVAAFSSEPLDAATVNAATFSLLHAGPDGVFGTGDDAAVAAASLEVRPQVRGVFFTPTAPLAAGLYRATLSTGVTDAAGVPLAAPRVWTFRVFDAAMDGDGDGLPDELELALGLNPNLQDSDGDGVPDGQEDFDGDGLPNAAEVAFNLDPTRVDSDMNGIPDGAEDPDQDGLTHVQELAAGTDPLAWDTDGDSFGDGDEVAESSDPKGPQSTPLRAAYAAVGVVNHVQPEQSAAYSAVSVRHHAPPEQSAAHSQASVQNRAAPQAVEGRAEARPITVKNQ